MLSPVYDLLNSTIAIKNASEEIALPINGKKKNLSKKTLIEYFGTQILGLNQNVVNDVLADFQSALPTWQAKIQQSYLSNEMKQAYLDLLQTRQSRLGL